MPSMRFSFDHIESNCEWIRHQVEMCEKRIKKEKKMDNLPYFLGYLNFIDHSCEHLLITLKSKGLNAANQDLSEVKNFCMVTHYMEHFYKVITQEAYPDLLNLCEIFYLTFDLQHPSYKDSK